jgi:hypothetical protein
LIRNPIDATFSQQIQPSSRKGHAMPEDPMEAIMPANPEECRERAQRCAKLAATAATPELAAALSDIAQKWAVLAAELDRTDRQLAAWQTPVPKPR